MGLGLLAPDMAVRTRVTSCYYVNANFTSSCLNLLWGYEAPLSGELKLLIAGSFKGFLMVINKSNELEPWPQVALARGSAPDGRVPGMGLALY